MVRRKKQPRRANSFLKSSRRGKAIAVDVIDSHFLTPDEERDRSSLEKKVERA